MAAVAQSGFYSAEGSRKKAVQDVVYSSKHLEYELEKAVDEVWVTLAASATFFGPSHHDLSLQIPRPPCYTEPPPSYDDAIADTPPEYSSLPPLAQRKTAAFRAALSAPYAKSCDRRSSSLKDTTCDVHIDFGAPTGAREHKGGKKKAKKSTPLPLGNTGIGGGGGSDNGGDDKGDEAGGNDGGGAGDGNGDDGDGADDWGAWAVSGSKKKNKKKEQEEEEERRAKEEEEKKASNNLSWADEMEDNNDDSWAGFATVGKKKKKGKVCTRFS
jgi:hypothetical protein